MGLVLFCFGVGPILSKLFELQKTSKLPGQKPLLTQAGRRVETACFAVVSAARKRRSCSGLYGPLWRKLKGPGKAREVANPQVVGLPCLGAAFEFVFFFKCHTKGEDWARKKRCFREGNQNRGHVLFSWSCWKLLKCQWRRCPECTLSSVRICHRKSYKRKVVLRLARISSEMAGGQTWA